MEVILMSFRDVRQLKAIQHNIVNADLNTIQKGRRVEAAKAT